MRNKDVVLMATVTSFESLPHPSRSELRQFAELFSPLFRASSDEARRQAVAALSQSRHVPPAVAFFIASQPIAVSAPFLTASPCLTNEALITIAKSQASTMPAPSSGVRTLHLPSSMRWWRCATSAPHRPR